MMADIDSHKEYLDGAYYAHSGEQVKETIHVHVGNTIIETMNL